MRGIADLRLVVRRHDGRVHADDVRNLLLVLILRREARRPEHRNTRLVDRHAVIAPHLVVSDVQVRDIDQRWRRHEQRHTATRRYLDNRDIGLRRVVAHVNRDDAAILADAFRAPVDARLVFPEHTVDRDCLLTVRADRQLYTFLEHDLLEHDAPSLQDRAPRDDVFLADRQPIRTDRRFIGHRQVRPDIRVLYENRSVADRQRISFDVTQEHVAMGAREVDVLPMLENRFGYVFA